MHIVFVIVVKLVTRYMSKYISLVPEQNRAQILKKENNYKEYIKQNSDRFELKTLSINSQDRAL